MPGPSNSRNDNSMTLPDDVMCSCNQNAVLLTVRKDGANKGRKFYKCAVGVQNGGCDFFLWAPDVNATINERRNDETTIVKCNCNQTATLRTVSKDGPNKGRQFYSCSKPMGQGCNFFKWADEVKQKVSL